MKSGPSATKAAPVALTFDLVRPLGDAALGGDPACGYGEWNDGTFGIDKKYSKQTTSYQEFSCYEKKGEVFPNAGSQMTYAEFKTPAQATGYADYTADDVSSVATLVSDTTTVSVRIGYLELNKLDLLKRVQNACGGCGRIVNGPHAADPVPGHVDKS